MYRTYGPKESGLCPISNKNGNLQFSSGSTKNSFQTLVIKTKTSLRNYRIYKTKHYFISEERLFSTLFDLVCYYYDTGDGLTVRMTRPGLIAGPDGPRRIRESEITIGDQIGHGHFGEGNGDSRVGSESVS